MRNTTGTILMTLPKREELRVAEKASLSSILGIWHLPEKSVRARPWLNSPRSWYCRTR